MGMPIANLRGEKQQVLDLLKAEQDITAV